MVAIVFDTETAGCKTQTLVNVGYKIVEINPIQFTEKTLVQRDYIVKEVFNNRLFMLNDMFVGAQKILQFEQNVKEGSAILRSLRQIFAQMEVDIMRYRCTVGYAYNAEFDIDKFNRASLEHDLRDPLEGLPIIDLWGMAYTFICDTPEYHAYCKSNQMLTESKRFFKTSVEGVIAFLSKNPEFVEDHTALSDVQHEARILIECLKRGANPFGSYDHGFIKSGHVFKKTLTINGETIEVEYTKMNRKWEESEQIIFTKERE